MKGVNGIIMITKSTNKINETTFYLSGKTMSYIMAVDKIGYLRHIYHGSKIRPRGGSEIRNLDAAWTAYVEDRIILETALFEYPAYGHADLRVPSYSVTNSGGDSVSELKFKGFEIKENHVPELNGLPCIFAGDKTAQTLEITLVDEKSGLEAVLLYTVFEEYDVLLRSVVFRNTSDKPINIDSAYSANVDIEQGDYDLIYFAGSWGRERDLHRQPIQLGSKTDISAARGSSSHCINPFVMIAERGADEEHGNVFGFSLIYSGNHSSMIECDHSGNVRVMQGINPLDFGKELKPGESFETPQCVLSFSADGIGGISRELSDLYRNNLCRSKWVHRERPVLINNWEATYFDFNEEKLLAIAKKAKEAGIELFVLDDGWFGKRDDDTSGLGDWFVNLKKLPSGLDGLAKKINDIGLDFGLWIEPEMVNPDSELYRAHPDWAIHVEGREPALSRNQLILDLSRPEVCDYIIDAISKVLSGANISYVKWDMNRPMTDMPRKGYNYEYMLGFYRVMGTLTSSFPDILFEGCAGGGGRFDAGVLAYMPQIWTSDDSDAIARLKIQYSTSMGYPISSMGAHVTAVPNHQVGRVTPLKTRADVAYTGAFGYELDITKMSDEEFEEVKRQVEKVKKLRGLTLNGDFYRLKSPYETNCCMWETVSKDKSEAFVMVCRVLNTANTNEPHVRLTALDPDADYRDEETGRIYGGDELMYMGVVPVYENRDFSSFTMHLKRV